MKEKINYTQIIFLFLILSLLILLILSTIKEINLYNAKKITCEKKNMHLDSSKEYCIYDGINKIVCNNNYFNIKCYIMVVGRDDRTRTD